MLTHVYPSTTKPSLERRQTRMAEIQMLKDLSTGLDHFKRSLDSFIEDCRENILPASRHQGLASLPDEILLQIFERLLDQLLDDHPIDGSFDASRKLIRRLSLVSKRFRENLLAFSEVWTYLDLECCGPETIDLFIHRSKHRPLRVHFLLTFEALESLRAAASHSDRWELFVARLPMYDRIDVSQLPSLSFPGVKRLVVWGWIGEDFPWATPGWSFPNVESVEVGDGIPNPQLFQYGSLRSFTFVAATCPEIMSVDFSGAFLAALVTPLGHAISLRELHLDLYFDSYDPEVEEFLLELELPNVEIFSISNRMSLLEPEYTGDESGERIRNEDYFCRIIRTFKFPKLRDFRVALTFRGDEFCPYSWFRDSGIPESVTSVTFEVRQHGESPATGKRTLDLSSFLLYFPSLRRLSVDVCDMEVSAPTDWYCVSFKKAPALESLQIRDMGKGRMRIHELLRDLYYKRVPLKTVDICSPYAFDVPALEKLVPPAKIHTRLNDKEMKQD